jgi:glycosyltransferase involved in cell wall biosynthesis
MHSGFPPSKRSFIHNVIMNQSEIVRELHLSDLFILSSEVETFGVALVEAQMCGLPVVCADCGGPRDIITEETGILVESQSIKSLTVGINKTIEIAKNMANLNEQDVEIVEFPNNEKNKYNKKDKEQLDYKTQLFLELMPENIQKELNELNIIPLLKDEKIYFMLPYHIEIN